MPFQCSICGEESTRICVRCTKDACNNHICDKCLRCSDCCECEVALSEPTHETVRIVVRAPIVEDPGDDTLDDDAVEDEPIEEEPSEEATLETEVDSISPPEPDPEPHIPGPDPDPVPEPTPEEPGPAAA